MERFTELSGFFCFLISNVLNPLSLPREHA